MIAAPFPPLSANLSDHYEVVNGQIQETSPMGAHESGLASTLLRLLSPQVWNLGLGQFVCEMLFELDAATSLQLRPDAAFVSQERWPLARRIPRQPAWAVVPDLAVEFVSPTNSADRVQEKLDDYFRTGVRRVWVVYPPQQRVYVYGAVTQVGILTRADTLMDPLLLPGISLPLSDLFADQID
jgi:Uma2 family endonuclease